MTTDSHQQVLNTLFKNAGILMGVETLLDNSHRVTEVLAGRMLDQIGLDKNTDTAFKLFDNACGIGSVAIELHRRIRPDVLQQSSILNGDFSESLIPMTAQVGEMKGWVNTEVRQIDGQKTGLPSREFTHVTTNVGLQVIPDAKAALDECIRVLQPGGTLAFTTWERFPGWAVEVESAFKSKTAFPFEAPFSFAVQTNQWGNWGNVNWIRRELEERRGLEDVRVDVFGFLSRVDGPDYWAAKMGAMVDWVVKSNWSEELQRAHPREEYMRLLKEYLREKYGGGGWDESWVAIVASARVPLAV